MAVKRKNKKRREGTSYIDYSLIFIMLFLLAFGLIMIYSASSYEAFKMDKPANFFFKRQLVATIFGGVGMVIAVKLPYAFYQKIAMVGYIISILMIFLVKTSLGYSSHGATRWIEIPGIGMTIQPAEVCKLFVILLLALLISKMGKKVRTWGGMIFIMVIALIPAAFIYLITKNLSSAIIVVGIAAMMLFVANPDYFPFVVIGGGVGALATGIIMYIVKSGGEGGGFRSERIIAWLNPESQAQGKGFQTIQALYAIGSGGYTGKGLGESMQKLNYLPESQNDMIFSIICEELGLFGASLVIILFIMMIWRLMIIANNATDLFGAMVVVGVMAHIAIQAILNIAVVTNTIPNTGISLPFISYGGTSVMFLMAELGIVLRVSKEISIVEE